MASDLGLDCVPLTQRKAVGMYGFTGFFFSSINTSRFICGTVKQNQIKKYIIIN